MAKLVNMYGETVVELVPDGEFMYKIPDDFNLDCLMVGDVYEVVDADVDEEDD